MPELTGPQPKEKSGSLIKPAGDRAEHPQLLSARHDASVGESAEEQQSPLQRRAAVRPAPGGAAAQPPAAAESRFAHDLSRVPASTTGFQGRGLLAHELAHVVQQAESAVQRKDETVGIVQLRAATAREVPRLQTAYTTANNAKLAADRRVTALLAYMRAGVQTHNQIKEDINTIMTNHQAAYDTFQGVLTEARMAAQTQAFFISFTISVLASLAAGPLVGGVAGTYTRLASGSFRAFAEAVTSTALSTVSSAPIPSYRTEGAIEVTSPLITHVNLLQTTVRLSEQIFAAFEPLERMWAWQRQAETLASDLFTYSVGGTTGRHYTDLDRLLANLDTYLADIGGVERAAAAVDTQVAAGHRDLDALKLEYDRMAAKGTELELEKQIWVKWMATLRISSDPALSQTGVLDINAIENHLRDIGVLGDESLGGSMLGIDFGGWTTAPDENAAAASAREYSAIMVNRGQSFRVITACNPDGVIDLPGSRAPRAGFWLPGQRARSTAGAIAVGQQATITGAVRGVRDTSFFAMPGAPPPWYATVVPARP
jgi:hypothetical protein